MILSLYVDSGVSCPCQQPSIELPLGNWIVMAVDPPFEGHETNKASGDSGYCSLLGRSAPRRLDLKEGNDPIVAESECVFDRIGGRRRTRHRARALQEQRRRPRAECGSTGRGNARTREPFQSLPATHPRSVSRSRPAIAQRRPRRSVAESGVPEEASSGVL